MKTTVYLLALILLTCSSSFAQEGTDALSPQAPIEVTDITLTPVPSPTPLEEIPVKAGQVVTPLASEITETPLTAPVPDWEPTFTYSFSGSGDASSATFNSKIKDAVTNVSRAIKGTCAERAEIFVSASADGKLVMMSEKAEEGSIKLIIANKLSDSCK